MGGSLFLARRTYPSGSVVCTYGVDEIGRWKVPASFEAILLGLGRNAGGRCVSRLKLLRFGGGLFGYDAVSDVCFALPGGA